MVGEQPREDNKNNYHLVLVKFMSFLDDADYNEDQEFSNERLLEITPTDVYHWFCVKAFGIPEPTPADVPTVGRSSSLLYYKKALSCCMPHQYSPWSEVAHYGNPTRSTKVNKLIKRVKKDEVRKRGKPSQARRGLEKEEFVQTIDILRSQDDPVRKYLIPAVCIFQYNMVARLDDTMQLKREDLKGNPDFKYTLLCQMCWSKNVHEERDAPDQLLLGSGDPHHCVLLALAVHLETYCDTVIQVQAQRKIIFLDLARIVHNKRRIERIIS